MTDLSNSLVPLNVTATVTATFAYGLCGILMEKGKTTDLLSNIDGQIQRIQTPAIPPAPLSKSAGTHARR
jgi:hypothetical protein